MFHDPHVKAFIPVGIQSFLYDAGRMCLLCIDGDDCERIWEAKDISLRESICSDD